MKIAGPFAFPEKRMIERNLQRSLGVEFLGSFALSFFAVAAAIATEGGDLLAIALAPGIAVGVMLAAFGKASIGCFNPAVALGLWLNRAIDGNTAGLAIISQILGALAGALSLYAIYPSAAFGEVDRGAPIVNGTLIAGSDAFTLSSLNAVAAEGVTTFLLMIVFLGSRQSGNWPMTGMATGFTITAASLAITDVSGAMLNPARSIGAAIAFSQGDRFWIWIVGPIAGALLAAVVHDRVIAAS